MFRNESAAMGLPMRMVVLTIVGMAGLAAMIMFIGDMELVPRSIHADIIGIDNTTTSSVIHAGSGIRNITVQVVDVDGRAVEDATVTIYGLHTSATGLTGQGGCAVISLDTSSISVTGEGYLRLSAKAQGFMDAKNNFALKVVSS
ncbi:MAG: hypothetical protein M8349_06135 [ANME-2 cluster archaeon]|nr:hypothetical protein [ANME-2 cluster archaeon]MDF1557601.1 hypothetical protein [ANME-2 cluster archaeon]